MARGYTPEEIQKEAARIRERVATGDMSRAQAVRWLAPLGVRLNGEPIIKPQAQAEAEAKAQLRQQELERKRAARQREIDAAMPPEEAVTSPEERMMRDFPPTPNENMWQEAARKRQPPQRDPMAGLGIPGPQVPGGQPQPGFFPPGQQGPPDPMAGLRGPPGPEPMGIPPMPPMTPGVPGGAEQPGFFPPQGSWGDTMVDQQRAKVARDAARNPLPQSPYNPLPGNNQPPGPGAGPPNPFAGLGDAFGAPSQAAIDQFAGGAGAVAPAPGVPQPPSMMPGGPPRPPQPRPEPLPSYGIARLPQARPEPPALYADAGGPRVPRPRPDYTGTLDVAREAAKQALRERDDMDARINRDELGADPGGFTAAAAERARQAQRTEPPASMQQSAVPILDPAREAARRTLQLHPDTGRIRTAPGFQQYEELARQPRIERNLFTGQPLVPASPFTPGLPRPRPENSPEEQAVRQTALGVPLPGDLIARPASPVETMGSDLPTSYDEGSHGYGYDYYNDAYGRDEEEEEEEEDTSAGLSAAEIAGLGNAVAETTGTYDGGGGQGVSPPPGIPEPEEPLPAIRLQPLIREEYVLPESSRNSVAFFGLGRDDEPVKHVQVGPEWEDPDYKFQKFGEPRSGSGFGRIAGGIIGGLAGVAGGGGLIGGGLGAYGGQKLGRKIGGGIGDPETGWGRRFFNPNYRRDREQELADIAANEYEKKYHIPFPASTTGARVIDERDLPPLIAEEEDPNVAIAAAEAGRQRIAQIEAQERAAVRDSLGSDSMASDGGSRSGGIFGYGGDRYGYGGGFGGYGGGYGPNSVGGAYRNR